MANEFFTDQYTSVMSKLVKEVVNDPTTYIGSRYFPSVASPVNRIRTEVIEANGGLTTEYLPGTDPLYIQSFGSRVQEFIPPKFKEAIHYDEAKILYLRELGQNDPSRRGIQQYLDLDIDRLNRRLEARIEKLRWDAVFLGGFQYLGKMFSYGIPAGNMAVPVGAVWSSDGISANNSADPIKDIRYWTLGGLAGFRKYKISKMIMNPNTARWILDNTNVQSFIKSYFNNPSFNRFDLNQTIQVLVPGAPEIEVYQGWYQTESLSGNKLVVSDAVYFIPDGYIFFEASLPGGDKIGEFIQAAHLAEGSVQSPGFGKFLVPEENIAPGTKGGPGNPYMDLIAGVYGGVKLDRPFDVLTAKVVT